MNTTEYKISDVTYNAANQCFEAVVTIRDGDAHKAFACAIDAPITMSFADAAEGLKTQAQRKLAGNRGLYSQMRRHSAGLRAGRPRFDPRSWLAQLGLIPRSDAA